MERIEAFENMLKDVLDRYRDESETLAELKAQGKEKSATFKQLMSNKLVDARIIALYREYGLVE